MLSFNDLTYLYRQNIDQKIEGLSFIEIQCYKYVLDSEINTPPDKTFVINVSPLKSSYDFNETVNFYCGANQMVYGPSSAKCTENGWKYDGSSRPACGCKCD